MPCSVFTSPHNTCVNVVHIRKVKVGHVIHVPQYVQSIRHLLQPSVQLQESMWDIYMYMSRWSYILVPKFVQSKLSNQNVLLQHTSFNLSFIPKTCSLTYIQREISSLPTKIVIYETRGFVKIYDCKTGFVKRLL